MERQDSTPLSAAVCVFFAFERRFFLAIKLIPGIFKKYYIYMIIMDTIDNR
mgnify:CR=1 FL=1